MVVPPKSLAQPGPVRPGGYGQGQAEQAEEGSVARVDWTVGVAHRPSCQQVKTEKRRCQPSSPKTGCLMGGHMAATGLPCEWRERTKHPARGAPVSASRRTAPDVYENWMYTKNLRYYLTQFIGKQSVALAPKALGNWQFVPADWAAAGKATDYPLLYPAAK
jgi:hypothetical protein